MAVTLQDVQALLDPEEPDYGAVTNLGQESLPHLLALVQGDDSMLASKAAYAASVLSGSSGREVVEAAARSDEPIVRVAAAAAARNLPKKAASRVLLDLVDDADAGVRRVARSAAPENASGALAERLAARPRPAAGDAGPLDPSMFGGLMPGEEQRDTATGIPSGLMPGEANRNMPGSTG
jgi:hypothetical protein